MLFHRVLRNQLFFSIQQKHPDDALLHHSEVMGLRDASLSDLRVS